MKVDGKDYLALYDKDNNQYTLRENGEVFDKENRKTDYVVKQDTTKKAICINPVNMWEIFI